jgi:hypothetical protein
MKRVLLMPFVLIAFVFCSSVSHVDSICSKPIFGAVLLPSSDSVDLPACANLSVRIVPERDWYKSTDSVTIVIENHRADSAHVSVGLDGFHRTWKTVVGNVQNPNLDDASGWDHFIVEDIAPQDSVEVFFDVKRFKNLCKKYTKLRIYIFGYQVSPGFDYDCYWESKPFGVKWKGR